MGDVVAVAEKRDFRAGERTFQLLTQVAGRAGRGERAGRVIVQAFDPDHPVVRLAADQDYERFYEREIRYRATLRYPPVAALVNLIVRDADELRCRNWARSWRNGMVFVVRCSSQSILRPV